MFLTNSKKKIYMFILILFEEMQLKKLAWGAALTLFTSLVNPNAALVESLFKRNNVAHKSYFSSNAVAAQRLEDTIKFEVNKKKYSIKRNNSGKFLVYDEQGNFVDDRDISQKVTFSKLVYDNEMKKLEEMPVKSLYSAYFKAGELAQYAKKTVARLFLGSHKALVESAKFGPNGALLATLAELTKEQILNVTKQIIKHPEVISRDIAISTYNQGYRSWEVNRQIESYVKKGSVLAYKWADKFLYNWFQANTLMPASNQLVNDIIAKKYKSSVDEALLNVVFDLMGRNLRSLRKETILIEINPFLNKSLGQYEPYQNFSKRMKKGIRSYLERKLELDKKARDLTIVVEDNSIDSDLSAPGWSTPEKAVRMYFKAFTECNFDLMVKSVVNSDYNTSGIKFSLKKTKKDREIQRKQYERIYCGESFKLHKLDIHNIGVEIPIIFMGMDKNCANIFYPDNKGRFDYVVLGDVAEDLLKKCREINPNDSSALFSLMKEISKRIGKNYKVARVDYTVDLSDDIKREKYTDYFYLLRWPTGGWEAYRGLK